MTRERGLRLGREEGQVLEAGEDLHSQQHRLRVGDRGGCERGRDEEREE